MNVFDQVRLVIFRINQKGLEVFLVNTGGEKWDLPITNIESQEKIRFIELDPVESQEGLIQQALAVEGDWHDIPSIRSMIKEDVRIVTGHLMHNVLPEVEKGAYFAVKEAFKKVMPEQYAFLKELKDILLDRNQVKYI